MFSPTEFLNAEFKRERQYISQVLWSFLGVMSHILKLIQFLLRQGLL